MKNYWLNKHVQDAKDQACFTFLDWQDLAQKYTFVFSSIDFSNIYATVETTTTDSKLKDYSVKLVPHTGK